MSVKLLNSYNIHNVLFSIVSIVRNISRFQDELADMDLEQPLSIIKMRQYFISLIYRVGTTDMVDI